MKGRRKRIALVEGMGDAQSGLAQARIVHGHPHQAAWTPGQSALQDGGKQLLRVPLRARVQKVLGAPTALFASVGPNHARQGATAQADQRAQGLAHSAARRTPLDKHFFPTGNDLQPGFEQHVPSCVSLILMKHGWFKKKALLLGPQQRVVRFANRFQPRFQLLVVLQPTLHLGLHLRTDAVLLGDAAGIADGEYPDRMASSALALRAAPFVANGALE